MSGFAARSASERSERLQQNMREAHPIKSLTSFSLTVFRLAHKCRTTAERAFALCTLHFALNKKEHIVLYFIPPFQPSPPLPASSVL